MAEHLDFGRGLKSLPHEGAIRKTYLGQAHIAGTGPEGKTCRECAFWGRCKGGLILPPGHYAESNKKHGGVLNKGGGAEEGLVPPLSAPEVKSPLSARRKGLSSVRAKRCAASGRGLVGCR